MKLEWKQLYGDLLVFKNKNDCLTISRGGFGNAHVDMIEIMGEKAYDMFEWVNGFTEKDNPFTKEEIEEAIRFYEKEKIG
jgi:hypothetical protein